MNSSDAKKLINNSFFQSASDVQIWADFGCGSGLFSNALINLLPGKSEVFSIDIRHFLFSNPSIHFIQSNFEKDELTLPILNGILMANSLHYVKDKLNFLLKSRNKISSGGGFILIEYETDHYNKWVPYPIRLSTAKLLFGQAGFEFSEKIHEQPSIFNNCVIYSAYFRKIF